MTERLLAYLLDDLSPEERQQLESELSSNPKLRGEFERLRECLCGAGVKSDRLDFEQQEDAPSELATRLSDRGAAQQSDRANPTDPHARGSSSKEAPPGDLVQRTCCLVQRAESADPRSHAASCRGAMASFVGMTPLVAAPEATGATSWRGPADWLATGGVCLLVACLAFPMLFSQREQARRMTCEDNLRAIGTWWTDFFAQHRGVPAADLTEHSGIYVLRLIEQGGYSRNELQRHLICPSSPMAAEVANRRDAYWLPTPQQFASGSPQQRASWTKQMGGSYATRSGSFLPPYGAFHQVVFSGSQHEPLAADAPSLSVPGTHSLNHGDGGQHILCQDVSVRYVRNCALSKPQQAVHRTVPTVRLPASLGPKWNSSHLFVIDHLFLNINRRHAGGVGSADVVLLRSEFGPMGSVLGTLRDLSTRQ